MSTLYVWLVTVQVGDSTETVNVEAYTDEEERDIASCGGKYSILVCRCTGEAVE